MLSKLPPEIWGDIFLACLPTYTSFSPKNAPTVFTRVCSSWRCIALSSPRLWSNIGLPGPTSVLNSRMVYLVEQWLDLSRTCALTIDFHLISDFYSWVSSTEQLFIIRKMLDLVAANSFRITRLLRIAPRYLADKCFLSLDSMPILEELYIRDIPMRRSALIQDIPSGTVFPTTLRTLTLRDTYFDMTRLPSLPPLRHLDLWQRWSPLHLSTFLEILSQVPSLESGSLYIYLEESNRSIMRDPVVLPRLQRLLISGELEDDIGVVLDVIQAPRLVGLGLNECSELLWPRLERFLSPCQQTLVNLTFKTIAGISPSLFSCMGQTLPTTSITVCNCCIETHQLMTVTHTGRVPCLTNMSWTI
ncbi:hypothetical protein BD410DRAFT_606757 [Rickenella mellea]|uniref:Uncharacterized protein n=1 Tax=Rickenella mellea TaxID=50990 RepID=A0A4Y7QEC8_9AGAM|nr:hypothetical protein BD410DRAFT_606757 [Rickenella mellea]